MEKIKYIILPLLLAVTQSCSFIVDVVLYNNTNNKIEVCNLNLKETKCILIDSKSSAKISLIGDIPKNEWGWSIQKENEINEYWFSFGRYPEHASNKYCTGTIQKKCDIPLQLEETGLLYWAGKDAKLPISEFPKQPNGFPVTPQEN